MEQRFTQLPGSSKVWIYQSSRELSGTEVNQLASLINDFAQQWVSHSKKVIAGGAVLYNRFIVLAADESAFTVSGCSIDSSVQFIRQIEQQFNLSLFDRLAIAWREDENIMTASTSVFQQLYEKGAVNNDTIVFNNLAATVADFNENWEVPLSKSWHSRYFKTIANSMKVNA